jgi:hypothetical protein
MGKASHFNVGREKEHHLSGNSHASPAPPSDDDRDMWGVRIVISTGYRQGTRNFDL